MKYIVCILTTFICCSSFAQKVCRTSCVFGIERENLDSFEFEFGNCDKKYHDPVSAHRTYKNFYMTVSNFPGEIGRISLYNSETKQGASLESPGTPFWGIQPTIKLESNKKTHWLHCRTEMLP